MDILGLFDGLFSAFGINRKMGPEKQENEPIKNSEHDYKQEISRRKKELYESRSKKVLDENRRKIDLEQENNKDF